ncbi:14579_t:CDS:2, partial [Acaulospora morrowiae]
MDPENSPRKRQLIEHGGELRGITVSDHNPKYVPNTGLRENVVSYLIKFVCTSNESVNKGVLTRRALELIKEFLQPEFWPEISVKLNVFDRTLKDAENQNTPDNTCNSLEVLNIILERKSTDWCLANIMHLQQLLKHNAFIKMINTTIQEGLQTGNNLYSIMMLSKAMGSSIPKNIDPFMAEVILVVQKLTKEVINSNQNAPSNATITSSNAQQPDSPISVLIMALQIVDSRISDLNEPRPVFLTCLAQLVEKTKDNELLRTIFGM